MVSSLAAGDGRRRFLIATGVTTGLSDDGQRKIAASVQTMVRLCGDLFGYQRVTSLALNPTADQMRRGIHDFCAGRDPDDVVMIYHTGHADLVGRITEHRLWMGDSTGSPVDMLRTRDLAEAVFAETRVRNVVVVLDTCYAGRGGLETVVAGVDWTERDSDRTMAVISAAHPLEQVEPGQFVRLFERAVRHPATGGTEPKYLHTSVLARQMEIDPERPQWQTISASMVLATGQDVYFPNPRYDPTISGRDEFFKQQREQAEQRQRELHDHFAPRGRGVENSAERAWRFVGRHAALRKLSGWLNGADPRGHVVTGRPGSGKSALLGRLVLLSDRELRGSVPLRGVPIDTVPDVSTIDIAVHARGKTTTEVREALAVAMGMRERCETVSDLLGRAAENRFVAVVDAVDEAVDQHDLVRSLLRPLLDEGPGVGLTLLLGTRGHLLEELGPSVELLDLDTDEYSDRDSLVAYVERNLRETHEESPYREADPELTHAVAEAVAERANRSFLVALIVSRTLAAGTTVPDPTDRAWRHSLPSTAAQAMANDLDTRLRTDDATRVRDLLTPLAFAFGAGLPWEDIWVPLANLLSGKHYSDSDILWLRRNAGSYIVESLESGRSAYRLYHEALAEHLREGIEPTSLHSSFVDFFLHHVRTPRGTDWKLSHHYALSHLSTHAGVAARLGELLGDPVFLLSAEQANLLASMGTTRDPQVQEIAAVYQLAAHHLRDKSRDERASYLELVAHRVGAQNLMRPLRELTYGHTWSTKWAQWKLENPHRVLHAHSLWVTGLMRLPDRTGFRDLVASCSDDGTIRVWDVRKGLADGVALRGHEGQVFAMDVVDLPEHGKLFLVSAGGDGTVRVWDLLTRRQRGEPLRGHDERVRTVVCTTSGDKHVIISADRTGQLLVWDLLSYRLTFAHPLCSLDVGAIALAAFLSEDGRHLLLVGGSRGMVRLFDVESGQERWSSEIGGEIRGVGHVLGRRGKRWIVVATDVDVQVFDHSGVLSQRFVHGHTAPVSWLSCTNSNGAALAVTTSTDGTIRIFDVDAGAPVEVPLSGSYRHSLSAVHTTLSDGRTVIVSGNNDGTIRLWDLDHSFARGSSNSPGLVRGVVVAGTRSNARVYSASNDGAVRQWGFADGALARETRCGASLIGMTSASQAGEHRIWPMVVADKRGRFYFQLEEGDAALRDLGEQRSRPTAFDLLLQNGTGSMILASAHDSGLVDVLEIPPVLDDSMQSRDRRHDVAKRKKLYGARTNLGVPATALRATSLGEEHLLVVAGENGDIHLLGFGVEKMIVRGVLSLHRGPVTAMASSREAALSTNYLATAADDHAVVLWDLRRQEAVAELRDQHKHHVHALTFLPERRQQEGLLLVGGGEEGMLKCWRVEDVIANVAEPVLTIDIGVSIRALTAAPDRHVVVGTSQGLAVIKVDPKASSRETDVRSGAP